MSWFSFEEKVEETSEQKKVRELQEQKDLDIKVAKLPKGACFVCYFCNKLFPTDVMVLYSVEDGGYCKPCFVKEVMAEVD